MQGTQADKELREAESPGGVSEQAQTWSEGGEDMDAALGPLELIDAALDKDHFARALLILLRELEAAGSPAEQGGASSGFSVLLRARAAMILGSVGRPAEAATVWAEVARYWTATGRPARALGAILQLKTLKADLSELVEEFSALYHIQSPFLDPEVRAEPVEGAHEPVELDELDRAWAELCAGQNAPGQAAIERMLDQLEALIEAAPLEVENLNIVPALPLLSQLSQEALKELLPVLELEIFARGERVMEVGAPAEDLLWTISDDFCVENPAAQDAERAAKAGAGGSAAQAQAEDIPERLRLPSGTLLGLDAFGSSPAPTGCDVLSHDSGELLRLRRPAVEELAQRFDDFGSRLAALKRQAMIEGLLERHPLFTQFPRDERAALAERFVGLKVSSGEALVAQGGSSPGLFLVLDGLVEVVVKRGDAAHRVESLERGGLFGAVSLVSESAAVADFIAASPADLLFLPVEDFSALVKVMPGIARYAVQVANQRIVNAERAIPGA